MEEFLVVVKITKDFLKIVLNDNLLKRESEITDPIIRTTRNDVIGSKIKFI